MCPPQTLYKGFLYSLRCPPTASWSLCAAVHGAELWQHCDLIQVTGSPDHVCSETGTHTHTHEGGITLQSVPCRVELRQTKPCPDERRCRCFLPITFSFIEDFGFFPLFAPRPVFPPWFFTCTKQQHPVILFRALRMETCQVSDPSLMH